MQSLKAIIGKALVEQVEIHIKQHDDQRAVAAAIGISQTDVSACKRGKFECMTVDRMIGIANKLGLVVDASVYLDLSGASAQAVSKFEAEKKANSTDWLAVEEYHG